MKQEVEQLDFI